MIFSPIYRCYSELFAKIVGEAVLRFVAEFVYDIGNGKVRVGQ